jgi:hypothetical protein
MVDGVLVLNGALVHHHLRVDSAPQVSKSYSIFVLKRPLASLKIRYVAFRY